MTTLPHTTHPVKPARRGTAPATCRLTLSIAGTPYAARYIEAPAIGPGARALRLRKADGTVYFVAMTPHGPTCDCPDQTWRREGRDPRGCKHCRSAVAAGLLH